MHTKIVPGLMQIYVLYDYLMGHLNTRTFVVLGMRFYVLLFILHYM
jgi:hypothetical protein